MKRVAKIAFLTGIILMTLFCQANAKGRKVKVYLDAPNNIGRNEEFSLVLMEQMRLADWDNDRYEFVWTSRAFEAEFIITIVVDQNPLHVLVKEGNTHTMCKQFLTTTILYKMVDVREGDTTRRRTNPDKTNEMVNQQLDCDPNEIARRTVVALEVAMGLKTERYAVQKQ